MSATLSDTMANSMSAIFCCCQSPCRPPSRSPCLLPCRPLFVLSFFVGFHVVHLVHLHVGYHVSHHVGHHHVVSMLCEGSETLTEWKSKSFKNPGSYGRTDRGRCWRMEMLAHLKKSSSVIDHTAECICPNFNLVVRSMRRQATTRSFPTDPKSQLSKSSPGPISLITNSSTSDVPTD